MTINNGILLNRVKLRHKFSLSASSIRFRLWGNTRKIIISDLKITLPEATTRSRFKSNNQNEIFSKEDKIRIFPGNRFGKFAARLITRIFKKFDLELRSCEISKGKVQIQVASVQLNGSIAHSLENKNELILRLSSTILRSAVTFDSDSVTQPKFSSGSLRLLLSCALCTDTGILSKGSCRLSIVESYLSVFAMLKLIQPVDRNSQNLERKHETLETKIEKLSLIHNRIFNTFDEISLTVESLQLKELPVLPASQSVSLSDYVQQEVPQSSFNMSVKSLSVNLVKIKDSNAGFDVLFNSNDIHPFELTLSSLILQFRFVNYDSAKTTSDVKEFLTIPNFSCTFKTNIPGKLIGGEGLRGGALELFCSCSSPIVELDVEQLALISFNFVALKKLLRLNKLCKQQNKDSDFEYSDSPDMSASEEDDSTRVETSESFIGHGYKGYNNKSTPINHVLEQAYYLLDECYPKVDIKLTIEQPRTILSCFDKKLSQLQFLMLSFSMMILQVSTLNHQEYDAKCHILHPTMSFNQKTKKDHSDDMQQDFCGIAEAKFSCRVMQNLKVNPCIDIRGAYVNLTRPRVLHGLNHLLNETTNIFSAFSKYGQINKQLDGELVKERDYLYRKQAMESDTKPAQIETLFAHLPHWLVSVTIRFEETDIWLGSTSPFLKTENIAKFLSFDGNKAAETLNKTNFHISSLILKLEGSESEISDYTSSVSTFSLETLATEQHPPMFWKSSLVIKTLKLVVNDSVKLKTSQIFEIPLFDILVKAHILDLKPTLQVDFSVDEISLQMDKYKAYALFGLVHLIKHIIVRPMQRLSRKLMKSARILKKQTQPKSKVQITDFFKATIHVNKLNAVVGLKDNIRTRVQAFNINMRQHEMVLDVQAHFLRALINLSVHPGHWDRVLCIDSFACRFNDSMDKDLIVIDTLAIRLMQPHKFVAYELFDSLAIFIKIIKHLVNVIKEKDKSIIVYPTESDPLNVPPIKLRSERLTFSIEDDPFESDLGMIYQLGLAEQKKRLDLQNLFEQMASESPDYDESTNERLQALYKSMEVLWIRKVKAYRARSILEIEKNTEFLFGHEPSISKEDNIRVRSYLKMPPLLHVILSGVDLGLSAARFAQKDLAQFIYDNGQGVPKNTKYSLALPAFMRLSLEELRIHLRDYPLPLLYLPYTVDSTGKGRALLMQGNLVITESMVTDDHSLRRLVELLTETTRTNRYLTDEFSKFDSIVVMKSLAPVKMYTDMDILFDSEQPSRFVWGQSYQFGLQQVILKVDQFSKPPIDPSPALGIWDKLRLIMHGHVTVKTGKRASLEVAFKGGRDPYNIFTEATGFILRMKDTVVWKINENDNSLEFFDVSAHKISWYIPNYLATPLVCWCRESSKYTLLSTSNEIITSCFGYYLQDTPAKNDEKIRLDVCEKDVVVLSGGVNLKVGFLLQRENVEGKITEECVPHYNIQLYDPEHAKGGHDSYDGFRSSRIHMAISFIAHTEESYNTIHLSPMTFQHFFAWWHLFAGNTMLPVRRGPLFGEAKQEKTKFSELLYTNKFLFHLKNLFLSHVYKNEELGLISTKDEFECTGLRAKIDDFLVDLHQRKEQVIDVDEDLSQRNKVMKMLFNIGEVVLTKIDLRTLHAVFNREVYSSASSKSGTHLSNKGKMEIFDKDRRWYDYRDYLEAFVPSSGTVLKAVEIDPLLYSDKFSYIRNSNDGKIKCDWGNEETHKCMLHATDIYTTQISAYSDRIEELKRTHAKQGGKNSLRLKESIECLNKLINECKNQRRKSVRRDSVTSVESIKEKFHNRFVLVLMFLKWNEKVRNQLMKYIHYVQLSSRFKKFLSYSFISMLEEVIENSFEESMSLTTSKAQSETAPNLGQIGKLKSAGSSVYRLKNFDKIVREVRDKEKIMEDYRIEIISPQIQLHTQEVNNSVVIITAPILESKIFSVVLEKDVRSNVHALETRYACLLHDASVLVFEKNESSDLLNFEENPYGTMTSWPPFLGIETCKTLKRTLKEHTLIDQMSVMLSYDEVYGQGKSVEQLDTSCENEALPLNSDDYFNSAGNRLRVDVPELVIRSTSKQYFTLYVTVLSLLLYLEPLTVELREKVLKLQFSIGFEDYEALHDRLKGLHQYLGITKFLLNNYTFRHDNMDNEALNDYLHLLDQKSELSTELLLTVLTLFSGDVFNTSSSKDVESWLIAADKITLHMLEDDRKPILDLEIEHGRYKRLIKDNGSNDNRIEISNIEGTTLVSDAYYKRFLLLLTPLSENNLIGVSWSMSRPIGGIKVVDNFEIDSLPLNVRMDEETGRLLMKFIFYTEDGELDESPILRIADQADLENMGHDALSEKRNVHDNESYYDEDSRCPNGSKDDLSRRGSSASTRYRLGNSQKSPSVASPLTKKEFDEEVELMLSRSKKYLSINRMTSKSFELSISLHMKSGVMKLLNVTDFLLVLPEWQIERKIISFLDLANMFKKLVLKTLLHHSGRLLKNKFSTMSANKKRLSERLLHGGINKLSTMKLVEIDEETGSLILEESESPKS